MARRPSSRSRITSGGPGQSPGRRSYRASCKPCAFSMRTIPGIATARMGTAHTGDAIRRAASSSICHETNRHRGRQRIPRTHPDRALWRAGIRGRESVAKSSGMESRLACGRTNWKEPKPSSTSPAAPSIAGITNATADRFSIRVLNQQESSDKRSLAARVRRASGSTPARRRSTNTPSARRGMKTGRSVELRK